MQELVAREVISPAAARQAESYRGQLEGLHRSYMENQTFEVGDLLQWKEGLKNKRIPDYDELVVAVEILAEPLFDATERSDSQYFREPLDMQIGFLDDDQEVVMYFVDSRRFRLAASDPGDA